MFVQHIQKSNIQQLRKMVHQVPTELRNLARAERQHLIKMDMQKPGTASYVFSHGEATKNNVLKQVINELRAKNAETFYKLPNTQMPKPAMQQVVKADMIF